MSDETANPGDDSILPFQLDRMDLRGRLARLDLTLDRMLSQHGYPPSVCALLGEAALLTAMIGQAMKLRGRFSVQARGPGAVGLIAADYFAPEAEGAPGRIRAWAQYDPDRAPAEVETPYALMGEGLFAMTIDQGAGATPYQGVTPLVAGGLAASAETWFAQSEQIATKFHLAVGQSAAPGGASRWRGGGVMLQHLAERGAGAEPPDGPSGQDGLMTARDVAAIDGQSENWRRAELLLGTADPLELIGPLVTPERLLLRLFHEESPRVYTPQRVEFGCTCDADMIEAVLRRYGEDEIREMADERGEILADCQFCGEQYRFTPEGLFEPAGGPA